MIYQLNDNEGSLWATIETDASELIVTGVWKEANQEESDDPLELFFDKMDALDTITERIWITEINP